MKASSKIMSQSFFSIHHFTDQAPGFTLTYGRLFTLVLFTQFCVQFCVQIHSHISGELAQFEVKFR